MRSYLGNATTTKHSPFEAQKEASLGQIMTKQKLHNLLNHLRMNQETLQQTWNDQKKNYRGGAYSRENPT